jgi:hypothetical protein
VERRLSGWIASDVQLISKSPIRRDLENAPQVARSLFVPAEYARLEFLTVGVEPEMHPYPIAHSCITKTGHLTGRTESTAETQP